MASSSLLLAQSTKTLGSKSRASLNMEPGNPNAPVTISVTTRQRVGRGSWKNVQTTYTQDSSSGLFKDSSGNNWSGESPGSGMTKSQGSEVREAMGKMINNANVEDSTIDSWGSRQLGANKKDTTGGGDTSGGTDVGDTLTTLYGPTGCSSSTHGYVVGGANSSHAAQNVISKFSLAASADATDVGDLVTARYQHGSNGISSSTYGYSCGGYPIADVIEKFSFSSDGNATDVADLTVARQRMGATTSTTHGYTTGGRDVGGNALNVVDKFNHTTDADATDVGDLTANLIGPTGQQF